jgi:hypothetical protein
MQRTRPFPFAAQTSMQVRTHTVLTVAIVDMIFSGSTSSRRTVISCRPHASSTSSSVHNCATSRLISNRCSPSPPNAHGCLLWTKRTQMNVRARSSYLLIHIIASELSIMIDEHRHDLHGSSACRVPFASGQTPFERWQHAERDERLRQTCTRA